MTSCSVPVVGLALGIALATATTAASAPPGPRDPDWPCEQIKVPQLSLAAMWSGPPLDQRQDDWRQDQHVADLVEETAQRRMPIEQAQQKIQAFAAQGGDKKQPKLLLLLAGLFSVLDDERGSVIAGLDRFGARQKELAAALRDDNEKLRAMQSRCKVRRERYQPDDTEGHVGGPGLSGPSPGLALRLRRARQDRAETVRAGTHHTGGAAMSAVHRSHSAACGRCGGDRSCSGRCAAAQPSVPSGYQATCV